MGPLRRTTDSVASAGSSELNEPNCSNLNLIVLDANAPWIRSLFAAMPQNVQVTWLRPTSISMIARNSVRPSARTSCANLPERVRERRLIVPGWTLAPRWTARLLASEVTEIATRAENPIVVYTLPQY